MKSLVIDANVFLRYLLRDVELQHQKASELIERVSRKEVVGKVSILVIDELIWALGTHYNVDRKDFIPKLRMVLVLDNIKIIEVGKERIIEILDILEKRNIDFTDVYLSKIATKKEIFSFDQDFKKLYR